MSTKVNLWIRGLSNETCYVRSSKQLIEPPKCGIPLLFVFKASDKSITILDSVRTAH